MMEAHENNRTWRDAIIEILNNAQEPMHVDDIVNEIQTKKMRDKIGATPYNTVYKIICDIKKEDQNLRKIDRATFFLQKQKVNPGAFIDTSCAAEGFQSKTTPDEDLYALITSFGMYWDRNRIDWKSNPQLWGIQQGASQKVNFCDQSGVYVLYQETRPVYAGKTLQLGKRLLEHTKDRLSGRWTRFSWFGIKPVNKIGILDTKNNFPDISVEALIGVFESLLIELLETPLNRKQGDGLQFNEFLQDEDGAMQKKQAKKILDEIISKM